MVETKWAHGLIRHARAMLALLLAAAASAGFAEAPAPPYHAYNVRLFDQDGQAHELYRYGDAEALVLFQWGNGCPIVRKSIPTLKALAEDMAPQGVRFLLLNANPQDTADATAKEAREYEVPWPILLDPVQFFTRQLGVDRTAACVVIDPQSWKVVYRGALDDRLGYGAQKPAATKHYLRDALEAVLEGQAAPQATAPVRGCAITFEPVPEDLNYVDHAAPILKENCARCHTQGGPAPFALNSFKQARGWREMMQEVVLTKRMPPWHAGPHSAGAFANDRSLGVDEARTLLAWTEKDAPRGEGPDPLGDVPPMTADWPLGEPDLVVSMPTARRIPASGVVDYEYVGVKPDLSADQWVRAAVVKPGNTRVLHHCLVFVQYPERLQHLQPEYRGGLDGYFAGYVPGAEAAPFPEGTGKYLPKDAFIVFQLHYTPTGRPEKDQTALGLYFHDGKPPRELRTHAAFNTDLRIPPHEANHVSSAQYTVHKESLLYSMNPHMHWRGAGFTYEAAYPDGARETLLSVPWYDFNWQTEYVLSEPKRLPAGTVIHCTARYDNSAGNPFNPGPAKTVYFGEQTWDEMLIGYLTMAEAE